MGYKIVLLFIVLMITGCTCYPVIIKPLPPPIIERPELAVYDLNTKSSQEDVVKKYVITIEQLITYSKQLETVIEGYKEQSK